MKPIKLKQVSNPPSPFAGYDAPFSPQSPQDASSLVSPPISLLDARDMKLFGYHPLTATRDIGVVRCLDCSKPILRSFMAEHADLCAVIRTAGKSKNDTGLKKRKASLSPDDPSLPLKKKAKPTPKVTKGRMKGPVDYDKQCGVINDKGLPCSRSLTCKSHSMGAKRAVLGRSRNYDELLLEWQRANNPNFVEPVKRETKAEKKEKREREKLEKKQLAGQAAAALGLDPNSAAGKKATANPSKKVGKKAAAAAAAAVRLATELGGDISEDLDDLDSEAEVDELVRAVRSASAKGVVGVPLAVPCDAGSWFIQRRERVRCCRDLLLGALGSGNTPGGIGAMAIVNRSASMGHNVNLAGPRVG